MMNKYLHIWFAALVFMSCSTAGYIRKTAGKELVHNNLLATAHTGISIYDAGKNEYLYRYNGDKYFVPASNTKIFSLYAGLRYLGDSIAGIRYRETNDSLIIYPTGDPTLLHPDFPRQPVIDKLKNTGKIIVIDTSAWKEKIFGRGWAWDDEAINRQAARSVLPVYGNSIMRPAIELLKEATGKSISFIVSPPGNGVINTVYSRHTDSLFQPMMYNSDNFFAEQIVLMAAVQAMGVMNDEKMIDSLLASDLTGLPQKPNWVDGSGLSRYNAFTPDDFVWMLTKMKNEFGMERLKKIFATGGKGTLKNYYLKDSGYIFAKTGTLTGQLALSGFITTRKNRLLIFSVLINNHPGNTSALRSAVEKFLTGIRNRL